MKLSIIGNGAMATALADGLKHNYELEFFVRDAKYIEILSQKYNCQCRLLNEVDIDNKEILLCVKPYALQSVAQQFKGEARTLYSILAGTPLASLKAAIKSEATIRAMPNLAAAFGASATTITGDDVRREEAFGIFSAIGDTLWLGSEKELDIATAVAGSGPAYLALVAEALMDGAVKQGIKRDESIELVRSLFAGFSALLKSNHPALIKDAVMSPAGTTAAGYAALEEKGVRDGFIKAVESAYKVTQQ